TLAPHVVWKSGASRAAGGRAVALTGFAAFSRDRLYGFGYTADTGRFHLMTATPGHVIRWVTLTPASADAPATSGIGATAPYAVLFSSASHGFVGWVSAMQHEVYISRTRDGGKHWSTEPIGSTVGLQFARVEALSYADPFTVYALVSGNFAAGHECRDLYRSQDEGKTWRLVLRDRNDAFLASTGMAFASATEGVIALDSQDNIPKIDETNDGGMTWRTESLALTDAPTPSIAQTYPPRFFGPDGLVGILPAIYTGGGLALYETFDAGRSFVPLHTPAGLQAVSFATAKRGLAIGQGHVLCTTDGAQVWQSLFPDPILRSALASAPDVRQLQYEPDGQAWLLLQKQGPAAAVASVLLHSADQGATWRQVD
ncbi:MAG: hypothetical protein OWU32_00765, partial [Firmicutes bacterium]|nr:hypothetical protein [Bacillota bacterium]